MSAHMGKRGLRVRRGQDQDSTSILFEAGTDSRHGTILRGADRPLG